MVASRVRLNWHGGDVLQKVRRAEQRGIDDTMAACTDTAKQHHPGWRNQTGTAEGSIRIVDPAQATPQGGTAGRWGSQGVVYMIFLELVRGAALRASAETNYPSLGQRIKQHLRGVA